MIKLFFLSCFIWVSNSFDLVHRENVPNGWKLDNNYEYENDTNLEFDILIKQKPESIKYLEKTLLDISNPKSVNYGHHLSKSEINEVLNNFTQEEKTLKRVLCSEFNCTDHTDSLHCSLHPTRFSSYEGQVMRFNLMNYSRRIFLGKIVIPDIFEKVVDFTLGLSDLPYIELFRKVKKSLDDEVISPGSIRHLYNISKNGNKMSSQAVAEFLNDECINLDDLHMFERQTNTKNIDIKFIGKCNSSTPFPDVEGSLDIQYQMGVNDHTNQYYINMENWMYSFALELFKLNNTPHVISISWGWSETDQCTGFNCTLNVDSVTYVKRTNIEFMKLALNGTTLVVSSGDAGSSGRVNEECMGDPYLNPVFPGGSPWIISVGGTVVTKPIVGVINSPLCKNSPCIIGGTEHNCINDLVGWSSGAGFSNISSRQKWQDIAVEQYLKVGKMPPFRMFNRSGRVYPDVTLVAHNYQVVNTGSIMGVDGTSASSPAFSAMISRLNNLRLSQNRSVIGLFGPLLYQIWHECSDCFVDLVHGSTNSTEQADCQYGYNAAKGYDAVYGVGLPNFDRIYDYVMNLPK